MVVLEKDEDEDNINLGQKRHIDNDNSDEEPLVIIDKFPTLLEYHEVLKEMQRSHIDKVSQSGRHLSKLLKWSVVDSKIFKVQITLPTIARPTINLNLLTIIFKEY